MFLGWKKKSDLNGIIRNRAFIHHLCIKAKLWCYCSVDKGPPHSKWLKQGWRCPLVWKIACLWITKFSLERACSVLTNWKPGEGEMALSDSTQRRDDQKHQVIIRHAVFSSSCVELYCLLPCKWKTEAVVTVFNNKLKDKFCCSDVTVYVYI